MIAEALNYVKTHMAGADCIPGVIPREVLVREGHGYKLHSTTDSYHGTPMVFTSLTGFVDYVKRFRAIDAVHYPLTHIDTLMVRVASPSLVEMLAPITEERQRPLVTRTSPILPAEGFSDWKGLEEFQIWLMTAFHQTEERDALLKVIAKVSTNAEATYSDDGVTQHVEMKKGVHLSERGALPNIVRLLPIRTFHEAGLEKVDSPFLLRVRIDEGRGVRVSLFEADGGAWRIEQMLAIRRYLDTQFAPEDNVLLLS